MVNYFWIFSEKCKILSIVWNKNCQKCMNIEYWQKEIHLSASSNPRTLGKKHESNHFNCIPSLFIRFFTIRIFFEYILDSYVNISLSYYKWTSKIWYITLSTYSIGIFVNCLLYPDEMMFTLATLLLLKIKKYYLNICSGQAVYLQYM